MLQNCYPVNNKQMELHNHEFVRRMRNFKKLLQQPQTSFRLLEG